LVVLDPVLDITESLSVGKVEHYHGARRVPIVHFANRSIPFLTSCVPYLGLERAAVRQLDYFLGEFNPDRRQCGLWDGLSDIPFQQECLPYTCVAHHCDFVRIHLRVDH
jgi:hypothetical protein